MSDTHDRSFRLEADATNAAGNDVRFSVEVDTAAEVPQATAALQAAIDAMPGYTTEE